jgi:hypothetical protein
MGLVVGSTVSREGRGGGCGLSSPSSVPQTPIGDPEEPDVYITYQQSGSLLAWLNASSSSLPARKRCIQDYPVRYLAQVAWKSPSSVRQKSSYHMSSTMCTSSLHLAQIALFSLPFPKSIPCGAIPRIRKLSTASSNAGIAIKECTAGRVAVRGARAQEQRKVRCLIMILLKLSLQCVLERQGSSMCVNLLGRSLPAVGIWLSSSSIRIPDRASHGGLPPPAMTQL